MAVLTAHYMAKQCHENNKKKIHNCQMAWLQNSCKWTAINVGVHF